MQLLLLQVHDDNLLLFGLQLLLLRSTFFCEVDVRLLETLELHLDIIRCLSLVFDQLHLLLKFFHVALLRFLLLLLQQVNLSHEVLKLLFHLHLNAIYWRGFLQLRHHACFQLQFLRWLDFQLCHRGAKELPLRLFSLFFFGDHLIHFFPHPFILFFQLVDHDCNRSTLFVHLCFKQLLLVFGVCFTFGQLLFQCLEFGVGRARKFQLL